MSTPSTTSTTSSTSTPQTLPWSQPSHPKIQKVIYASTEKGFGTKSYSTISVAPNDLYTTLYFPPCTILNKGEASYATVQIGENQHVDLGCDFLYTEHSCDPSLVKTFDTTHALDTTNPRIELYATSKGLKPNDELTFFYPSTEWNMAQPFDCHCGSENCLGKVKGASELTKEELQGAGNEKRWVSQHVSQMLSKRDAQRKK